MPPQIASNGITRHGAFGYLNPMFDIVLENLLNFDKVVNKDTIQTNGL